MTRFIHKYSSICHFILASLPLLIGLALMLCIFGSEAAVTEWCKAHALANPDYKSIAKIITDWGNTVFYPVYLWFLITGIRQRKKSRLRFALVFLAVQLVVSLITVRFLKIAIGRPRPGEGLLFEPFSTRGGYHSLPSGHTCEVYGASLPLVLRYRTLLLTLLLGSFAAAVALSRVYLTWHHPSDIFFGWMLGSVAGFATHLFSKEN